MKIAIVKPDYHIQGGFEIVVEHLAAGLRELGHQVSIVQVDITKKMRRLGSLPLPRLIYESNRPFFDYLNEMRQFRRLNLTDYDLVISTQPPSFCVSHPRHI